MAESKPQNVEFLSVIQKSIEESLKHFIDSEYEKLKKDFIVNLEREKAKAIAGMAIQLMKMVDFQMIGNKIVISVVEKDKNL